MGEGQALVLPAQNLLSVHSRRRGLAGRLGHHWEPASPLWSHPDPPFPSALTPPSWPLPLSPAQAPRALQMALPLLLPRALDSCCRWTVLPTPIQDGLVFLPMGLVSWISRNKAPQTRRLNTTRNGSESPTSGVGVLSSSQRPQTRFLSTSPSSKAPGSLACGLHPSHLCLCAHRSHRSPPLLCVDSPVCLPWAPTGTSSFPDPSPGSIHKDPGHNHGLWGADNLRGHLSAPRVLLGFPS